MAMNDKKIELLNNWYRRIRIAQRGHYEDASRLKRRNVMFGIPVIILSAAAGTGVLASLAKENPSQTLRIVLGCISILAAGLALLQTFLNYSEQSSKHMKAATELSALKKEIEEKLALLPDNAEGLNEFIKTARSKWDAITNEAPIISQKVFEKNFIEFKGEEAFPGRRVNEKHLEKATLTNV
jgi:hypothetical protein